MTSPSDNLQKIRDRLAAGATPQQVIEDLSPRTRADAESWTRRLPIWDEYREQFPAQTIAIARLVGKRGMRAFSLTLTEDGRVVSNRWQGPSWETPKPSKKFKLSLNEEEIRVEYTPSYFRDGTDLLYFVSPHEPVQPHCLSGTGHWSKLTPHDQIVACGGPEVYAALLADAQLRGEVKEFEAVFQGQWPQIKQPRRRKTSPPVSLPVGEQLPVLGEHTAQVIAEQEDKKTTSPPRHQRTLFDDVP